MKRNEDANPWQTLNIEERYENPWISVTHHIVTNPAGNPGIYGKVHFKNTAVGVLPLDSELNTWLIGQYRYPLESYSWEIPEGGCPGTEQPQVAAQRELAEEAGIVAGRWTELLKMHLSNSVSDELAICYIAQDLTFTESAPEDTEQLEIVKIPFEQALDKVLTGKITDSMSVASILKVALMLERGLLRI